MAKRQQKLLSNSKSKLATDLVLNLVDWLFNQILLQLEWQNQSEHVQGVLAQISSIFQQAGAQNDRVGIAARRQAPQESKY